MSVRIRALGVCTLVAGLVVGCLGEDAPGDGGGALSGTWVLPESAWLPGVDGYLTDVRVSGSTACPVKLSGSAGTANCDATITGNDEFDGTTLVVTVTLSASIVVREDSVAVDGTRSVRYQWSNADTATDCTQVFSGTADKDAGRESAGRFSALAGNWLGSVNTSTRCTWGSEVDSDADAWQFTADLFGEHATVEGQPLGGGATSTWLMQNSPQGMVVQRLGSDDGAFAEEID